MHNENRFLDTFRGHNTRPTGLTATIQFYTKTVGSHLK